MNETLDPPPRYVRYRRVEMHRCPDCGVAHIIRKHGRGSQSKDPNRPRGEPYEPRRREVEVAPQVTVVSKDAPRSVEDLEL